MVTVKGKDKGRDAPVLFTVQMTPASQKQNGGWVPVAAPVKTTTLLTALQLPDHFLLKPLLPFARACFPSPSTATPALQPGGSSAPPPQTCVLHLFRMPGPPHHLAE